MIDPLISLAFSVFPNKGVYAMLLGSGVSRAAEIPTGWEVVLDLTRKLAKLLGEDCEPDPVTWYKDKHGADPDYSKLLDALAKTSAERQGLLRGYFEPTEEERQQGSKMPTAAHKAIASLAAAGYIRVIITTNFDRLIEKALEEAGVAPTVISNAEQIMGALPLVHSRVTVIKLHGDYLDTRLKNTEAELAAYDTGLNALLDRVFDEYGLLVCGWSGEWDAALRAAIERCPSRRFTTYWATRSPLPERAKRLAENRRCEIIQIKEANQFFTELAEKVRGLEEFGAVHPLSSKLAITMVKRYLVDPTARIRLRDLVHEETEKLFAELQHPSFTGQPQTPHDVELNSRVKKYESLSELLLSVLITGSYWDNGEQTKFWIDSLERVGGNPNPKDGYTYLCKLRRYPALLLFYGAGIASLASRNYATFAALLTRARVTDDRGEKQPLVSMLTPIRVFEGNADKLLAGMERRHTPVSDHLFARLREFLREYLPGDDAYMLTFDYFEYLLALVYADITRKIRDDSWWGPTGRFGWRGVSWGKQGAVEAVRTELETQTANWGPLQAGLFGGSVDQAKEVIEKFGRHLQAVQSQWHL